jgi:murein DD-endopeptidase MepM/ murein hydrolase activator NlpD
MSDTLPREDEIAESQAKRFDNPIENYENQAGSHDTLPGYNRSAGGLDNHPVSAKIADAENSSDDLWHDKTDTGKKQGSFKKAFAQSGAVFVLTLILGPIGALSAFFMNPLMFFSENAFFTNNSRVSYMERRVLKLIDKKLAKTNQRITGKPNTVIEKFDRIPNKLLMELDKAGIKPIGGGDFSSGKGFADKPITGFTVDDGSGKTRTIKPNQLVDEIVKNPKIRGDFHKAVNVRWSAFRGKLISKKFFKVRGINKDGGVIKGDEHSGKSAFNEKIKKLVTNQEDDTKKSVIKEKLTKHIEKMFSRQLKKIGRLGDPILAVGGVSCAAINGPKLVASAVRGFILGQAILAASDIILSPASKIQAGEATAEQASEASSALTATDEDNLSALDSSILQKAVGINTGHVELGAWVAAYAFMGSSVVKGSTIASGVTKNSCDIIYSPQAMMASAAISAASLATGPGAAVYGAAKAVLWTAIKLKAAETALGLAAGVIGAAVGAILSNDKIRGALVDLISYNAKQGVDLGNYLGMAIMAFFSDLGLKSGEAVLTKGQLAEQQLESDKYKADYIAEVQATKSPFDTSSQFTFLGSIVSKLGSITRQGPAHMLASSVNISSLTKQPTALADSKFDDYSEDCNFGTSKVALNAACTPYTGMPSEYVNMSPDRAMKLVGSKNIDKEATDTTEVIPEDSELATQLEECGEGSIESLDGCTLGSIKGRGGGLSDSQINKQCTVDGVVDNNCVNAIKNSKRTNDPEAEQKIAAGYIFSADLQAEAMLNGEDEEFESESAPQQSPTGDAATFNVASYNLCHEISNPCMKLSKKLPIQSKNITNGFNGQPLDIIGTQETSQASLAGIKQATGYQSFPAVVPKAQGRAIIWNPAKFTMASSGNIPNIYSNDGSKGGSKYPFPWVELKTSAGQSFFVTSIHNPNSGHGGTTAIKSHNVTMIKNWAKSKSATGNVIITGDFNRNVRSCDLVNSGFKYARDVAENKSTTTCNGGQRIPIDQVYVSTSNGLSASGWGRIENDLRAGTDHGPSYVTLSTPGGESTSTGAISESGSFGNISFPLAGGKSVVKNSGIFSNNDTSKAGHPYLAYDISAPAGTVVKAFADGTVTNLSSGSLGKGVSIYNKKAGLVIYYTHMDSTSVSIGDKISAGDPIGKLASVRKYPGINVDHLHIDASTDRIRQPCSRSGCSIMSHFRPIGKDLFRAYNDS